MFFKNEIEQNCSVRFEINGINYILYQRNLYIKQKILFFTRYKLIYENINLIYPIPKANRILIKDSNFSGIQVWYYDIKNKTLIRDKDKEMSEKISYCINLVHINDLNGNIIITKYNGKIFMSNIDTFIKEGFKNIKEVQTVDNEKIENPAVDSVAKKIVSTSIDTYILLYDGTVLYNRNSENVFILSYKNINNIIALNETVYFQTRDLNLYAKGNDLYETAGVSFRENISNYFIHLYGTNNILRNTVKKIKLLDNKKLIVYTIDNKTYECVEFGHCIGDEIYASKWVEINFKKLKLQ